MMMMLRRFQKTNCSVCRRKSETVSLLSARACILGHSYDHRSLPSVTSLSQKQTHRFLLSSPPKINPLPPPTGSGASAVRHPKENAEENTEKVVASATSNDGVNTSEPPLSTTSEEGIHIAPLDFSFVLKSSSTKQQINYDASSTSVSSSSYPPSIPTMKRRQQSATEIASAQPRKLILDDLLSSASSHSSNKSKAVEKDRISQPNTLQPDGAVPPTTPTATTRTTSIFSSLEEDVIMRSKNEGTPASSDVSIKSSLLPPIPFSQNSIVTKENPLFSTLPAQDFSQHRDEKNPDGDSTSKMGTAHTGSTPISTEGGTSADSVATIRAKFDNNNNNDLNDGSKEQYLLEVQAEAEAVSSHDAPPAASTLSMDLFNPDDDDEEEEESDTVEEYEGEGGGGGRRRRNHRADDVGDAVDQKNNKGDSSSSSSSSSSNDLEEQLLSIVNNSKSNQEPLDHDDAKEEQRPSAIADIIDGPSTKFGTGMIANLTNGCVLGVCGQTVVMSTVVHIPAENEKNDDDNNKREKEPLYNETVDDKDAAASASAEMSFTEALGRAIRSRARKYTGMVPLTVDYRERHHGVGRIPTNHGRRDNTTKPTDEEVLASRAIDRAIRPLLPKVFYGEMDALSVTCSVQACDYREENSGNKDTPLNRRRNNSGDPVALAVNSASAALVQSGLPFEGPVGCVRICLMDEWGTVVIDPTPAQIGQSQMELLYAGTNDRAVMIEFSGKPVRPDMEGRLNIEDPGIPEHAVGNMIRLAHGAIQPIIESQLELRDARHAKISGSSEETDFALAAALGLPVPENGSGENDSAENDSAHVSSSVFNTAMLTDDFCQSADDLLEEAFQFINDRIGHVALRLFGYDELTSRKLDGNSIFGDYDATVHPIDKPLLSKKVRGRREHLFRVEINRLLREEFAPAEESLQRIYRRMTTQDVASMNTLVNAVHERLLKSAMYTSAVKYNCRGDGRGHESLGGLRTVRSVSATVPLLPEVVHGSALFSRGETQVMCTATLGAPREGQPITNPYRAKSDSSETGSDGKQEKGPYDDLPVGSLRYLMSQEALQSDYNSKKVKADREMTGDSGTLDEVRRAFLHYDFPAYSTGEVKTGGVGANRRAIGHGTLAERSIVPALPPPSFFPYAIRLTSEVTSSNGSSSMASACGATLALLDAGVPIVAPVAGVSVGLAVSDDGHTSAPDECKLPVDASGLLLDITGTEDHYGEMDFKIAGTAHGVTAMQLDVKKPLPIEVLAEAMKLAKAGRRAVLDEMARQSFESSGGIIRNLRPREKPKSSAPRVEVVRFNPLRKRDLIGPGGAVLRQLEDRFGVSLDLSQEGKCLLHGTNAEMVAKAKSAIMDLVADVEEGGIYEGTVIEIKDFGAVVELLRNKEGLLHVSELADSLDGRSHPEGNLGVVRDYLKVGQKVEVLCIGVDPVQGSIKLSRKKLLNQKRR